MACAARLAKAGHRIILIERNARLGGKVAEIRKEGFRWDIGPSLVTMPEIIRDLAEALGSEPPVLEQLPEVCRYFWPDGTRLDADEAFCRQPEVARFLEYCRGIYELSGEAYLQYPPGRFWKAFRPGNLGKLVHFPKIATFSTMSQAIRKRLRDPYHVQLFERFATYNGSSPYLTPATFNVIPYVENHFGAWYPEGGVRRLADWLEQSLQELGVEISLHTEAVAYDGKALCLSDGRTLHPEVLICNGEVETAYRTWLRHPGYRKARARTKPRERSLSGFVLLLGVRHRFPHLRHHNIFFSADYKGEFDALFRQRSLPQDPTVYLNISARTSPEDAPPDQDNYFLLVNAPAETERLDWEVEAPRLTGIILDKLEGMGCEGLREAISTKEWFTPKDFARRDLSSHGALYGAASHGIRASLFRPPLESPQDPKLFFTGGSTHPGGGIPLVLLSARMTTEAVIQKLQNPGKEPLKGQGTRK